MAAAEDRAAKDAALDAEAKAATAKAREQEAARLAEDAKVAAARAAEDAKAAAGTAREAALTSKKDTTPRGSVDLWPELYLPDADLAAKIASGKLDGVLSELRGMLVGHPRTNARGEVQERQSVIAACEARLRRA